MAAGKVDGVALAAIGAGALFAYAGIKGKSVLGTAQGLVQGKSPATAPVTAPITGATPAESSIAHKGQAVSATGAANQALARQLAPASWTTGQTWQDWVSLWDQESGWSNTADTRASGLDAQDAAVFAYGVAQARPYSKMPRAAWPPDKGGSADPRTQILWGIGYIQSTYGDPSQAWAHEQANGWY